MTAQELRNRPEYRLCMNKIRSYKKGFEFTVNFGLIPRPKANALKIVLRDAVKAGYIESIEIGLTFEGEFIEEKFRKITDREGVMS